jgi:ribose transport system ATP-binding protein
MTALTASDHALLDMRGISKHFPGVTALSAVEFAVRAGEIHALIGQNGAGKSTLMKVLAGVYQPDAGEIRIGGALKHFVSPRAALDSGVGIVYQDLSLVPKLSVADNIFLGREIGGGVFVDQPAINAAAERILSDLNVGGIDVRRRAMDLPLAQQQLVEIAKVLSHEPRILVMDEPTAALAEEEAALLLRLLRGLRARGIAIIYISHRFKEIMSLCDRATILRNGQRVSTVAITETSENELIELTIGERVESFFRHSADASRMGAPALEVEHLRVGRAVRDVSFTLRQGEILGITGLLGAGQNELARALFGLMPETSGMIRRQGKPVLLHSPKAAIAQGIGLLTEQRKTEGLVMPMTVRANLSLPSLNAFRRALLFLDRRSEGEQAAGMAGQVRVKAPSLEAAVGTLSGGNQQKVILGKWLLRDLDILIFISPTQGIDVGAKAEIYAQLGELAQRGKSIIVVSEDLLEILGISDRILVLYQGQLLRTFDRADAAGMNADEERLLAAIQGDAR